MGEWVSMSMTERMTKEEFKKWLKARTRMFAVRIFQLVDELPKSASTHVISFQLAKSASSMGANYREATRAESGADFAHKIGIVEKESDETLFWLEVLSELYPPPHVIRNRLDPLFQESDELLRLFTSIKKGCTPAARQSRTQVTPTSSPAAITQCLPLSRNQAMTPPLPQSSIQAITQ